MIKRNFRPVRFKNTVHLPDEPIVQNGLAVTPRNMLDMSNNGIPITPNNLALQYNEGVSKLDFDVPMDYQRGVDICDMWEHREDFKNRMKSKEFRQLLNTETHE